MGATEGFMKAQIEQLKEENKELKEKLSEITMVADDEKQSIEHILELEEENKKLKHENSYRAGIVDILPKGKGHIAEETIQDLQVRIKELSEENKKLRETIKDHQLYEEKLEHRIIELEELLHGE